MNTLLDEYYRYDLHAPNYIERKVSIAEESLCILGVSQSGKTALLKHYLLEHKKSTYLYLDCNDLRLDMAELNHTLEPFCQENKISILALDNYTEEIKLFPLDQILLTSERPLASPFRTLLLNPLDYEEFLAFESKYDDAALNHFFQLGGFPAMHRKASEERLLYLQKTLKNALGEIELSILTQACKMLTQKVSAFNLYERLKSERKISKDKLYLHLQSLLEKRYLYALEKFNYPSAVSKLYVCDIALQTALNFQKHFGRVFENLVFLELIKHQVKCYYEEGIDFYLPERKQIILASPFANEHALFKKIEALEGFIITHDVREVIAVTMNTESSLSHPIANILMIPFSLWALGEE